MKLILADTVKLMNSEDYRDRFVAEYIQTKIRYEKLKDFNTKIEASVRTRGLDNGVDEPLHDCPAGLLREQQAAMGEYLHLLEVRAKIEDIDLEDAIQYFSDKKRDLERKVIDGSSDVDCKLYPVEERKLELSICADCVHYPICKYLVGRLEGFKLPNEYSPCDLFESVNGWGEERKDESDVTINEQLPEGVMSLEETIEVIMKCEKNKEMATCNGCQLYDKDCRSKIMESSLYHLVKYENAK